MSNKRVNTFKHLVDKLFKLTNREQYLRGWLHERDVAGDSRELEDNIAKQTEIRQALERLSNKREI